MKRRLAEFFLTGVAALPIGLLLGAMFEMDQWQLWCTALAAYWWRLWGSYIDRAFPR